MLTINDIKNANLTKTMMGGYKIEEVDDLLNKVCQTLEMNERQKGELTKKLKILGDRVEQYRNDEQTIKNALYDAHKRKIEAEEEATYNAKRIMETTERKTEEVKVRLQQEIQNALNEAKEIKAKAQLEAKEVTSKAQFEASELLRECEIQRKGVLKEIEHAKHEYIEIQNKIVQFRNELIEKYKEHLQVITELPSSDTVKEAARQLDMAYPTGELTKSVSQPEAPQSRYEEVQKDFDRIIQKTLEFDVDEVKKAIYDSQSKQDRQSGDISDSQKNMQSYAYEENFAQDREEIYDDSQFQENASEPEYHNADENSTEYNDDRQKVRVTKADKRGKISYTSRTITPPPEQSQNESDADDSQGIKIVDVDREEHNGERQQRTSRFFS